MFFWGLHRSPFFKCLPFYGETTSRNAFQNYGDNVKEMNTVTDFKKLYAGSPEGLYVKAFKLIEILIGITNFDTIFNINYKF